ncbi:MAG: hypothetical protein ISR91_01455 [Candidatus Delongbacteria bacterium]|nr:hypothetical protein [Candidatus Delongbacteria bacterium]
MEAVPPWRLKYINLGSLDDFSELDVNHGAIGCANCHGGDPAASTLNDAHGADFLADPSEDPVTGCGNSECHPALASSYAGSMHLNLWGERQQLADRAGYADFASCPTDLQNSFNGECTSCHATCGDCHISRPNSVGGGLVDNHIFYKTPDREDNCEACHGSRVAVDYEGQIQGVRRDAHSSAGWSCTFVCHVGDEMHADASTRNGRYDHGDESVTCTQCHLQGYYNIYHLKHWPGEVFSGNPPISPDKRHDCFVCHAQEYNNCDACHTAGVWTTDEEYHERNPYTAFKIGYNINDAQNDRGKYVVVRHVPVTRDTYAPWGLLELTAYDDIPNWKYATPHNIQRWTRQTAGSVDGPDTEPTTETCFTFCHPYNHLSGEPLVENRELFLTHVDLADPHYADDPSANWNVIVDDVVPSGWITD